ncbi:hypothetical protein [Gimesia panareensis]|uniref:hypothetical protein n=1 Tax=Gimesia panareensis TaxID=2527978 RepID=UPI001E5EF744|nr:hypothetical protein [Gimesia panareensis]
MNRTRSSLMLRADFQWVFCGSHGMHRIQTDCIRVDFRIFVVIVKNGSLGGVNLNHLL